MKRLVCVLATLLTLPFLASCGTSQESSSTYKVTLNAGEGYFYNKEKVIEFSNIKDGTRLYEITNYETPTKDGSYFSYWTFGTTIIKESYVIHEDLNLVATFSTDRTYTVTLNANGGYFSNKQETTKDIKGVTKLTNTICEMPNRDDEEQTTYYFTTWYKEAACINPVIFNTLLTGNITIYAGWSKEVGGDFSIVDEATSTPIDPINNVYSITSAGTYSVEGKTVGSQIRIDATKNDEITLNFNGAAIYSSTQKTAINIVKADKVTINLKEETINTIFDKRTYGDSSVEEDVNGAINAKSDLTIKGKGTLYINDEEKASGYARAIQTSKELKIKNASVIAYGIDSTIKAKQGIEIEDANVRLISKIGDGLKTEDIDLSSKGKRRGDIKIVGDTYLEIFSAGDAIDASHDVLIDGNENGEPNITIATSKFSSHTGTVTVDKKDLYMRASNTSSKDTHYDPSKYWCAIYCGADEEGEEIWEQVKLKKTIKGTYNTAVPNPGPVPGSGTNGYYYSFNIANDISEFTIYLFKVSQLEASTEEGKYFAKSEEVNVPTSTRYDTLGSKDSYVTFPASEGSTITGATFGGTYSTLVESSDHDCGVDYSNKGIKADNEITINAGDIDIQSYDDSLHTSYGLFYPGLEDGTNFEIGTGNININGGDIDISSGNSNNNGDDAIHSAGELSITGGDINITHSYEGIEAGHIIISGGTTKLYAYDDGANATNQGNITDPDVTITGGTLDITIASGDTDGIDSNGTYHQSGGVVVTRGDPSSRANSTGLDTDGVANITGGIFLCLGKTPETKPTCGENVISNDNLITGAATGTHTLTVGSISYTFTNNSSYSGGAHLYYLSTLGTPSIS